MTKFPILETAFSGYRLLARRPGVALAWFAFHLVTGLITVAVTVAMAGPQLMAMKEMQTGGSPPDQATMMSLMGQILPFWIVAALFTWLTIVIVLGASARIVLRPAEKRFGYLRFGGDELRLLVVTLVLGLIFWVLYSIASAIGMVTLIASSGQTNALAISQGDFSAVSVQTFGLVAALVLPVVLFLVFLYVKLSLATAQTVGERAIRMFGSWKLTKGAFWRTFAVYALAAIPLVIAAAATSAIGVATSAEGFAGGWQKAMQPDVSSMAAAFSGLQILNYALSALVQTLSMAALLVPAAVIYAAVSGHEIPVVSADDDDDDDED